MNLIMDMIMILLLSAMVFCWYMLIRSILVYNHESYWVEKIYHHKIDCILNDKVASVDYSDILDGNTYLWMLFTFSKDKMISDKNKRRTLEHQADVLARKREE